MMKQPKGLNDIEEKLFDCFKEFLKLQNSKEFYIADFKNYDISNDFDLMQLYDFEIIVEDKFFESTDTIPDGVLKTIPDYIKFIEENKK